MERIQNMRYTYSRGYDEGKLQAYKNILEELKFYSMSPDVYNMVYGGLAGFIASAIKTRMGAIQMTEEEAGV